MKTSVSMDDVITCWMILSKIFLVCCLFGNFIRQYSMFSHILANLEVLSCYMSGRYHTIAVALLSMVVFTTCTEVFCHNYQNSQERSVQDTVTRLSLKLLLSIEAAKNHLFTTANSSRGRKVLPVAYSKFVKREDDASIRTCCE